MATAKDGVLVRPNTRSKRGGWIVDIRIKVPSSRESIRERTTIQAANKTEARNWGLRRREQILAQGGTDAPDQAKEVPTLATFKERFVTEHMKAEQRKPSSIEAFESVFRTHLAPPLGMKRLNEITLADVQGLKATLLERRKGKTVNNVLSALSSMLRRAVEWGVIDSFPRFKLIKTSGQGVTFYDFSDYFRLVEAARALDPRTEALVLLAGDAGLRRGEIMALEWTDLDFKRRQIHVQRSEWSGKVTAPKGGRSRIVPMTDALVTALNRVRHLRGPRVLCRDEGTPLTNKIVRMWILSAQRRAGLPAKNGGIHFLRHTFCSHLAMQGAPAKAIQELAGHSTLTMTQRYMHLSPAAKDSAIALLNARPVEPANEAGTTGAQIAGSEKNPSALG